MAAGVGLGGGELVLLFYQPAPWKGLGSACSSPVGACAWGWFPDWACSLMWPLWDALLLQTDWIFFFVVLAHGKWPVWFSSHHIKGMKICMTYHSQCWCWYLLRWCFSGLSIVVLLPFFLSDQCVVHKEEWILFSFLEGKLIRQSIWKNFVLSYQGLDGMPSHSTLSLIFLKLFSLILTHGFS